MPVHRERVDPIRTPDSLGLVHRRWLIPDDVQRPIGLAQASRLWRALLDLAVIDPDQEALVERLRLPGGEPESLELPARASAGALLAGTGAASLVTQVVWTDDEGRLDPYGEEQHGFRDYTLYVVDSGRHLLLPLVPAKIVCGACGAASALDAARFGEGALLDLARSCAACGAPADLGRDKGELRTGAVFLLEELVCRAALSIELPAAPEAEELPNARVAEAVREAFGGTDELADDGVAPAQ